MSPPAPSGHGSSASLVRTEAEYEGRMAHLSAFLAPENGLVEPCARHDSNVRPLLDSQTRPDALVLCK
jgi:hypothetical protein